MNDTQQTDEQTDVEAQKAVDAALRTQDNDEQPQDAQEAPDSDEDDQVGDSPNREAAKYRVRLRETEGERDALATRLQTAQRREVERIAEQHGRLARPAALWAGGTDLADLLDDEGNVDPDRVASTCDQVATDLGLTRTPRPNRAQREEGAAPKISAHERAAGIIAGR